MGLGLFWCVSTDLLVRVLVTISGSVRLQLKFTFSGSVHNYHGAEPGRQAKGKINTVTVI